MDKEWYKIHNLTNGCKIIFDEKLLKERFISIDQKNFVRENLKQPLTVRFVMGLGDDPTMVELVEDPENWMWFSEYLIKT